MVDQIETLGLNRIVAGDRLYDRLKTPLEALNPSPKAGVPQIA